MRSDSFWCVTVKSGSCVANDKYWPKKKHWVIDDILEISDKRRKMKGGKERSRMT